MDGVAQPLLGVHQDGLAAGTHRNGKMPAVLDLAEAPFLDHLDRSARHRRHAVIALLAVEGDVLVAELAKSLLGKQLIGNFRLLQAEHVRRLFEEQALDDGHAKTNGVDVPGGYGKRHARDPKWRGTHHDSRGLGVATPLKGSAPETASHTRQKQATPRH